MLQDGYAGGKWGQAAWMPPESGGEFPYFGFRKGLGSREEQGGLPNSMGIWLGVATGSL